MTHGKRLRKNGVVHGEDVERRIEDTSVSLREFVESKLESLEKATAVAYEAMEERLKGMNEFRDALRDQTSNFLTRTEFIAAHERVCDDIRILREYRASLEGKASQQAVVGAYILAAIGFVIGILGLFHI